MCLWSCIKEIFGYIVNQRGIEANLEKIKALVKMRPPQKPKEVQQLNGHIVALSHFISKSTDRHIPFFRILKGEGNFGGWMSVKWLKS